MVGESNAGGAKLFAAIGVTYPAGSAVTCTNGTKTLSAKNTSGQWVFSIPEAGTWTLTASDGTNTKSQSVSISKEGQFESVELAYQLVLFNSGVGKENWIGKYTQIAGNDASYTIDTGLAVSANADGKTAAYITLKDAADLSKYNTLTLEIDHVEYPYSGQYGKLYVYIGTSQYGTDAIAKQVTTTGTLSIDISGLTGTGYFITLAATCSGSASGYPEYSFSCSDVVAA